MLGKKSTKPIYQTHNGECGLACLVMVARSLGSTITLDELRQISPVSSRGTTLKNVIEAAAYADVTARPIRCEPAALKNIEMPAILHWKFNHFVVLNNVKRGSYEVIDPAGGRGWVEIQELSRCFTGIAIEIKRAAKFTPRKPNSDISFLHLIKMLFADRMLASSCLTSSILVLSAEVGSIVVYQVFIDKIIRSGSSDALYLIALLFVAMLIIAVAARYIRASSARMLVSNFDLQLSTYVAHRLLHLPLSFHLSRTHSEIMRYVRSARPIRQAASVGFVEVILDAMSILLLSLVIYFYSPIIWFSMLGIILLYALFRIFRLRYVRDVLVSYSVNDMHESSVLQENTRSVETIKLYAAEQIRHVIWRQSYHKVSSTESVLENCRQEDAILGDIATAVSRVASLALSALLVINNQITIGMFVSIGFLQFLFFYRIRSFIDRLIDIQKMRENFKDLATILLEADEKYLFKPRYNKEIVALSGKFSVSNLSFRYSPNDPYVFKNLSFEIAPGEIVAIVGRSGAGKSTLVRLLTGLLTPTSGTIRLDDIELEDIGLANARRNIGTVLQDDHLFSGTIEQNISMFDPNPDEGWIKECAKNAHADGFIKKMTMGYSSMINRSDAGLSGGERQRLLLARALYKQPKILILDEASSHLDVDTEIKINEVLKSIKITRIMIAHRQETISLASKIVRL